jgi:carboxypeptidase PM20D1
MLNNRVMRSVVRRCLLAAAAIVAGLCGVVAFRTVAWRSAQLAVDPVTRFEIEDGAIDRLARAVRLRTLSRAETTESDFAAFDALDRDLERSFPLVHNSLAREVVGGHSLLFTWQGKEQQAPSMLLLAHMDVVPVEPETESAWTHGPFSGEVAEGFIWGRGTLDDKVSVMAILEAVETLLKQGFQPRQTVLLAFGHDEETGGEAGAAQIAALLKSRRIRVAYALDEGSAITQGIVPGLDRPAALIGIAEKGFASVELTAVSAGGHSSMPPPHTAIGIIAAAVHALENDPMPASLEGPGSLLFDRLGPEMPLLMRIPLANRWIFGGLIVSRLESSPTTNAIVRTTTAATIIEGGVKDNVLPARARAVVNFRIKPGETAQDVLAHVVRTVNDRRVQVGLLDGSAAHDPSPNSSTTSAGFLTIERTVRQVFPGTVVAPSLVVAGTDSRHYQEVAADVYRFTPFVLTDDDTRRIHGTDERISVEGYRDCVRFYVQLLINAVDRRSRAPGNSAARAPGRDSQGSRPV